MKKILSLSILSASLLSAYEFHPLGFQSIGMGGAGVTTASGSMAGYYNPALLAKTKYDFELSIQAGVGIKEDNLADQVDKLSDVDLSGTIDEVTKPLSAFNGLVLGVYNSEDKAKLKTAREVLESVYVQNNLTILPTASFATQYKNFSLAMYSTTTASAQIIVDPNALELYSAYGSSYIHYDPTADGNPYSTINLTQAQYEASSLEYALDNGKTYIDLKGVSLAEIPLSYANSYDMEYGNFSLGGSLKFMELGVYSDKVNVDTNSDDLADKFSETSGSSSNVGLDLGFIYSIDVFNLGLVAKNLNSPKFDKLEQKDAITVEPQLRGGMSLTFDWIDFAVDYDITENDTALNFEKSQYVGGGINLRPFSWFSLRAGVMNNIAYKDSANIYTAGIGLGIKQLQFDLSAQVSDELKMVDGNEVTDHVKVNFALISRWGENNRKAQ